MRAARSFASSSSRLRAVPRSPPGARWPAASRWGPAPRRRASPVRRRARGRAHRAGCRIAAMAHQDRGRSRHTSTAGSAGAATHTDARSKADRGRISTAAQRATHNAASGRCCRLHRSRATTVGGCGFYSIGRRVGDKPSADKRVSGPANAPPRDRLGALQANWRFMWCRPRPLDTVRHQIRMSTRIANSWRFTRRAWGLAAPYWSSEERWTARLLLVVIVVLRWDWCS